MKAILLYFFILCSLLSCENPSFTSISNNEPKGLEVPSTTEFHIQNNIVQTPTMYFESTKEQEKVKIKVKVEDFTPQKYIWYVNNEKQKTSQSSILIDSPCEVCCVIIYNEIVWSQTMILN